MTYFNFFRLIHVFSIQFDVLGEDFSPSSGSSLISSIIIQYNGTLDELGEDGLKSSPETSRCKKNTCISRRKNKNKLYFSYTLTPAFVIALQNTFSGSLSLTDDEMPGISRHSLLEYWAFVQHSFSLRSLSDNRVFTCSLRSYFI